MLEGLRVGDTIELERDIPAEWSISTIDPALPPVLGTPAMIVLMEMAAAQGMATCCTAPLQLLRAVAAATCGPWLG